jgi:hypothetical protein
MTDVHLKNSLQVDATRPVNDQRDPLPRRIGGWSRSLGIRESGIREGFSRLCVTCKCHIVEMNGESYRFRESMKAKKAAKASK